MKPFLRFFIVFGVTLALIGAGVFPRITKGRAAVESTEPSVDADASQECRITRFLVMGTDRSAKLTDSIFLVTLNESEKNAHILQIPRDTYANYTDKDYKKLNGAMNVLGENGVKDLLSEALGVKIDFFVILDLSCLRSVVDAIGGVDVDIPQDMHYSDPAQGLEIHLPAGMHRLDGVKAEQFVRYRSGYVNADLGRLDAQKLFMQAFAKKCCALTASQMLHVTGLALTKLQTDVGLPEAIRVVSALRECDTDNIPMATLAGQAVQGKSGAWYYAVNREGACRMINEYLLPEQPIDEMNFDPKGLFNRPDHEEFHKIYIAPEGSLPVG